MVDIIKFIKYLEIFTSKAGVGDSNIKRIYSIGRATIVKKDFIIIVDIEKNNFIIEFGCNNINNIKKEVKYYKKNYNTLIIITIIKFLK